MAIKASFLTVMAASLALTGCGIIGGANNATVQASRVQGGEVVAVNRYLWAASLDVLSFLPIQSADPFTGVIITGFGTPPGGSRAYKATVHVRDPALAARSLNLSLVTRSGPASVETVRAVENAILTRARQLRVQDSRL